MPQYKAPQSDASRRDFMEKALQTAVLDQANDNCPQLSRRAQPAAYSSHLRGAIYKFGQ